MDIKKIVDFVNDNTAFSLIENNIKTCGGGATATVYLAEISEEPKKVIVKISPYYDIIEQEYKFIKFISERVDCKLPHIYYFGADSQNNGIMIMEYFDGQNVKSAKITRKNCSQLSNQIIDNLIKIHSVHNDKYGPINNAIYDTWRDYYKDFAQEIYDFSKEMCTKRKLFKIVLKAVELANENLDIILKNCGAPSLIHGDYWQPNIIVNQDRLVGVLDPFNVMWAEPEYELFCLTVINNKKLNLYENYKNKVKTSEFCDLKIEMYALFNELLWYKKLGKISHTYLLIRAVRLIIYKLISRLNSS